MLVEALKKEEEEKRQQWIEIGEARGETKGRAVRNREITGAMAENGYSIATIAHLLGLGEEEVQALLTEDPSTQSAFPPAIGN